MYLICLKFISYILIALFVCLSICQGPETQILSVRLSRSWNPDPNYCLYVEVLKPRSRLSICRGHLQQKFDRAWEGLYICRGGGRVWIKSGIKVDIRDYQNNQIPGYLCGSQTCFEKKTNIHFELSRTRRFFEVFSPTQTRGSLWFS
jgi:hypothetical protein